MGLRNCERMGHTYIQCSPQVLVKEDQNPGEMRSWYLSKGLDLSEVLLIVTLEIAQDPGGLATKK
jgi:hypothetical protein